MMPEQWLWPHFTPEEMQCQHCRRLCIVPETMNKLERIRVDLDSPMTITSGYRCPVHNANVASTGLSGPHTTGQAVDVAIYGETVAALVALAHQHGMTGFGLRQKGAYRNRIVHLDDLEPADGRPRPHTWTY